MLFGDRLHVKRPLLPFFFHFLQFAVLEKLGDPDAGVIPGDTVTDTPQVFVNGAAEFDTSHLLRHALDHFVDGLGVEVAAGEDEVRLLLRVFHRKLLKVGNHIELAKTVLAFPMGPL